MPTAPPGPDPAVSWHRPPRPGPGGGRERESRPGTLGAFEGPGPGRRWGGEFGPLGGLVLAGRTPRARVAACPVLGKESENTPVRSRLPCPGLRAPFHLAGEVRWAHGPAREPRARAARTRGRGLRGRGQGSFKSSTAAAQGLRACRMPTLMGRARRGWGAKDTPLTPRRGPRRSGWSAETQACGGQLRRTGRDLRARERRDGSRGESQAGGVLSCAPHARGPASREPTLPSPTDPNVRTDARRREGSGVPATPRPYPI